MLDRVLRGDHEEGRRESVADVVHRDLPLGHRFQEGALRARRGAVDLVGQQHVGEDRAGQELEFARLLVEDAEAGDVAGQQVRRALHAGEPAADGRARALASVVLPRPGRSSSSRCPRASRQASTNSITSGLPRKAQLSECTTKPSMGTLCLGCASRRQDQLGSTFQSLSPCKGALDREPAPGSAGSSDRARIGKPFPFPEPARGRKPAPYDDHSAMRISPRSPLLVQLAARERRRAIMQAFAKGGAGRPTSVRGIPEARARQHAPIPGTTREDSQKQGRTAIDELEPFPPQSR